MDTPAPATPADAPPPARIFSSELDDVLVDIGRRDLEPAVAWAVSDVEVVAELDDDADSDAVNHSQ